MTIQIAVRLPEKLVKQLDQLVPDTHASRSEVIRRAIEFYLYRLACENDADQYERTPLHDSELALADDPAGWSNTAPW